MKNTNPAENQYDFSSLEAELTAAWNATPRYMVVVRLGASTYSGWDGQRIPSWVVSKYSLTTSNPPHTFQTNADDPGTTTNETIIYAAPWHNIPASGETVPGVQGQYNRFIRELANPALHTVNGFGYLAHPCLAAILLTSCSSSRGEEDVVNGRDGEVDGKVFVGSAGSGPPTSRSARSRRVVAPRSIRLTSMRSKSAAGQIRACLGSATRRAR